MIDIPLKPLLMLSLIVAASGCSIIPSSAPTSDLEVKVRYAPQGAVDSEVSTNSQAMHAYLLGRLADNVEDPQQAMEYFSEATKLIDIPEPDVYLRLAELSLLKGDLDQALNEVEKAEDFSKESVIPQLVHAEILELLGRSAEAFAEYEGVLTKSPEHFDARILYGAALARADSFERAITVVTPVTKMPEHAFIAHYYLGRLYEQKSDLHRAEEEFREALTKEPGNPAVFLNLIRVLARQGHITRAIELCDRSLKEDSGNMLAMALKSKLTALNARNSAPLDRSIFGQPSEDIVETKFKLALHLIEGRDFAGSLRELTLILAKDTTNAEARYYLASIYAGTSRRKQAVVELLKITPDQELFVKSRTFAAFIMRQDGNLDQAEAAVREAYEQDPTDKKVLIYLVAILRDARRFSEAQDLLETALETEPNNDKLLFNYAVVLGDQGKKDQGMEVMEKVIALNPEHSDALNFVAFGLAENDQDLDRALALVTKALETRPNDGFYLDTLGWIYFQQQKFEKAEEVLARAANLSGDDVAILEHHGDALRALNRNQEAFRVYTAALEKARDTENPPADLVEIRGRLEDKLHDVGNLASDTQVQTEHKH